MRVSVADCGVNMALLQLRDKRGFDQLASLLEVRGDLTNRSQTGHQLLMENRKVCDTPGDSRSLLLRDQRRIQSRPNVLSLMRVTGLDIPKIFSMY